MRKEQYGRTHLKEWIMNNCPNVEVFFDYSQNNDKNTFQVKGTRGRKPDMLLRRHTAEGIWTLAVEIKQGDSNGMLNAYDQIEKYALDYKQGKAEYFVAGKKVFVHSFLVATPNSSEGFLYAKEEKYKKDSMLLIQAKYLKELWPTMHEFPMSYMYSRFLFRLETNHRFHVEPNKIRLGTILCDKNKRPIIFQCNSFIQL